MRVLIDLLCVQPIGSMKFHGGGEYTKTVFNFLLEKISQENSSIKLIVCYNYNQFLDEWILDKIEKYQIEKHCVTNIREINLLINDLAKNDEIRFFAGMGYNYQNTNVSFPSNVFSIGVFHGLRVLEKPYDREAWRYGTVKRRIHEFLDWVLLKNRNIKREEEKQKNAIANFDVVVTVSKHSAYSLKVNFGGVLVDKRILVLYSPLKFVPEENIADDSTSTERYIMLISADRWLKNCYRGLVAIDSLYSKGYLKGTKTKVFGNAPESVRKDLRNINQFEFYDYVSNDELERAYQNCELFLYPTLNEGFGYPPLEAMKYGKTCAISAVSSLTEVYKDSVYYFNPYDQMEIENRILQALDSKIDTDVIYQSVKRIQTKQIEDLNKLSRIILGEED